jgi:hypothetical protein
MQRPVHVLADVDDGRFTDLILPDAVSDAGAVVVEADDYVRDAPLPHHATTHSTRNRDW